VAKLDRIVEVKPDAGGLRVGVGGMRDGLMVGPDVLAERDPGDHLALVDREMGMHLGAGWVARDVDVVGDPEPIVGLEFAVREVDTDGFEPESRERRRPADRKEELVALDIRRVG